MAWHGERWARASIFWAHMAWEGTIVGIMYIIMSKRSSENAVTLFPAPKKKPQTDSKTRSFSMFLVAVCANMMLDSSYAWEHKVPVPPIYMQSEQLSHTRLDNRLTWLHLKESHCSAASIQDLSNDFRAIALVDIG